MLILQHLVNLVVIHCVILYPEYVHQVHLDGLSKLSRIELLFTKLPLGHLKGVNGLTVEAIGELGRVLQQDTVDMFFPIKIVHVVQVIRF